MDRTVPRRHLEPDDQDTTTPDRRSASKAHPLPPLATSLLRKPTFGGVFGGLLFWSLSLPPTLLPRTWAAQAAVSAISFGAGYILGSTVGFFGHVLLHRLDRKPGPRTRRLAWQMLAIVALIGIVAGSIAWPQWQNEQRQLVALDSIERTTMLPMLVATVVSLFVLALVGRLIWRLIRILDRLTKRYLPFPMAVAATVVVVSLSSIILVRDVAFDWFVDRANDTFGIADTATDEGVTQPTSDLVSGGPGSLVPWDTLGRQGRNFTAGAATVDELTAFHGDTDVEEPIRVYAGLLSADDAETRAELALAELQRTGAFDRSVLVIATATGTGWIDPFAAEAIEHLHRGDTAIASIQYSFLPSWISFLVDLDVAAEAGSALYETVYEHWSALPRDHRPKLVIFGQSLGSFGAEAAFAGGDARSSINNLTARSDGALFTGPVEPNPVWGSIVRERDPGSPVWRPTLENGKSVRVANSAEQVRNFDPEWNGSRILYVHHASDPVGLWNWKTIRLRPEWMDRPRGDDVPDGGMYFPVVTFTQVVADLIAGFAAPPGHGHDYSDVFVPAWAQIVPPEGWTDADTERLTLYLGWG